MTFDIVTRAASKLKQILGFVVGRLKEPSTYASVTASIAAASVLVAPYSYMSLACGLVVAMVPNRPPSA